MGVDCRVYFYVFVCFRLVFIGDKFIKCYDNGNVVES